MSGKLGDYLKNNYPDSKSDMYAVFIEKCGRMLSKNGYQATACGERQGARSYYSG